MLGFHNTKVLIALESQGEAPVRVVMVAVHCDLSWMKSVNRTEIV